jgi:predicted regulator of Ras-like GTPase activity (Roadblock/LC7/MglB family)
MAKINDVLKEFRAEVGGEMIQMTVSGSDGMSIARETIVADTSQADQLSGRALMALQTAKRVTEKLKLGDHEETILTTDKAYIYSKFLGDGSYVLLLSVTRKATLGTVRMLIEEYAPKIWDAIPR